MGIHKCNIGLICAVLLAVCLTVIPRYWELKIESIPVLNAPLPPPPQPKVVEDTIQKNRTLVATLVDYDIPVELANQLADLIKPVFDVRHLRFGNPFRLEKEVDGSLKKFEYKIDDERVLKVQKGQEADSYEAHVEKVDLETRENIIDAEISSSLWAALGDQPKSEYLVTNVAGMFQWDVDFNTAIQPGDKIRIITEAQYHDGNFIKYGKIQAAELLNAGHTYRAFLFKDEYYDEKGNAVKRAMLASPLQFNPRITSGFSRARLHPILGGVRPHLAVDFGAPIGAPVVAVANGTVTFAGWSNGYGNLIQIRHVNGLTTGYGHLSKIAAGVHTGVTVRQNQVIGLVGMTGLATGPHLHYMMTRGGTPINPLSVKSTPSVPIAPSLKSEYLASIASRQVQFQNQVASKSEVEPIRDAKQ
jgi:murein DD-endopeptidase MepM/ murein hydrolase activator NlpD